MSFGFVYRGVALCMRPSGEHAITEFGSVRLCSHARLKGVGLGGDGAPQKEDAQGALALCEGGPDGAPGVAGASTPTAVRFGWGHEGPGLRGALRRRGCEHRGSSGQWLECYGMGQELRHYSIWRGP